MINKKIWLALLLAFPLYADLSISEMETMVERIKAKRAGSKIKKDTKFVSPFVMINKENNNSVMKEPEGASIVFVLGGIMNNKAFLNEKWVKVGDTVDGYTLKEMDANSVTLVQNEHIIKVFLKKSKSILQINEG